MITHMPTTLAQRALQVIDRSLEHDAARNAIIRRGQIIVANLGNITGEQPDLTYELAIWYIAQAAMAHDGNCETELHKRIKARMDEHTLSYCATGRA